MPSKNVRYKSKTQPMKISFLPESLTPGKSGHVITARPRGSSARIFVLFITFFLFVFTMMSIYAVCINPANAVSWATLVFIGGLFVLLLMYEENIFPSVSKKKLPFAFAAWFLLFITIPYVVVMGTTFDFTLMILIAIFGLPCALLLYRVLIREDIWQDKKASFKEKVSINNLRKKKAKPTVRKRKIYRR